MRIKALLSALLSPAFEIHLTRKTDLCKQISLHARMEGYTLTEDLSKPIVNLRLSLKFTPSSYEANSEHVICRHVRH